MKNSSVNKTVYEIICEIYEDVNNSCPEDSLPTILDYTDAVINYRKEHALSDSTEQVEAGNEDNGSAPEGSTENAESEAEESTKDTESGAEESTDGTESGAEESTDGTESGAEESTKDTESEAEESTDGTESGAEESTKDTESEAEESTKDTESGAEESKENAEQIKEKSELDTARIAIKHTVSNSLNRLVKKRKLTRFGKKYVSNRKGLEYYSRLEIIRTKCLQYGSVIKLSEKAVLLSLGDLHLGHLEDCFDSYYIYEAVKPIRKSKETCSDSTSEQNNINESEDSSCIKETQSEESNSITEDKLKQFANAEMEGQINSYYPKTADEQDLTEYEMLKKEIESLKKQLEVLSSELAYNKDIDELKKLIQGYLCRISFTKVINFEDVFLIIIESNNPGAADLITQKLQGIIDETRPKRRPLFKGVSRRVFYK